MPHRNGSLYTPRRLRAIFVQNHAERSIETQSDALPIPK
jgi:hypothetical protein